jgi:DNA polymerase-3 subunit delta
MDFFAYYKQLTQQTLPKVNLFYGFERFLLDNTLKYIESNFLNPMYKDMNLSILDGTLDVSELERLVAALPFFDNMRIIVIQNANIFKQETDQRLLDVLASTNEDTRIIIIEKDIDKRKKLYKLLNKEATVVNFERLNHKEFLKWTKKKFSEYGKDISQHSLNYFIEMVNYLNPESGRNLYEVSHYIRSITSIEGEVTTETIDQYIDIPIENNIFKMMDALSTNKMEDVLFIFNQLIRQGEAEIKIFFLMSSQFRNIYKCKLLIASGHTSSSIASKLDIHPFVAKKATHFASQFSLEELRDILDILVKIDKDIKSSGTKPKLLIEKGILEMFMIRQAKR